MDLFCERIESTLQNGSKHWVFFDWIAPPTQSKASWFGIRLAESTLSAHKITAKHSKMSVAIVLMAWFSIRLLASINVQ